MSGDGSETCVVELGPKTRHRADEGLPAKLDRPRQAVHDHLHEVTAISSKLDPVVPLERRGQSYSATSFDLVAYGAVLGVERRARRLRGSDQWHQRHRDQGGNTEHAQATPTTSAVVQWNIWLVLAMHQLMSLCTPRRYPGRSRSLLLHRQFPHELCPQQSL